MSEDRPFEGEDEEEAASAPSAVDPASQKRIRNREKREQAERAAFWGSVLALEVGRREMWEILNLSGRFREVFHKKFGVETGFPHPELTDYYDGMRDLGERVWISLLKVCPDGAMLMLKEHHPALRPPPKVARHRQDDQTWPRDGQ